MRKVQVLAATLTLALAGTLAGGVQARVQRPQTRGRTTSTNPVTAYTQEFAHNKSGFCNGGSGTAKCDGAVNDYGTIDRVPSGFSNGGTGDYAPRTPLVGSWMAEAYGSQMPNEGQSCPQTTTEYCSGPYALFTSGSTKGEDNVFPTGGFTVTDDLYLSPSTATAGNLVDDDVELNDNTGSYGRDNVITACPQSGGYVINFGNSSPGSCTGTPIISADGWYRFVFVFSDVGGNAYVAEKVVEEDNGSIVANSGRHPEELPTGTGPTPISQWGGQATSGFPPRTSAGSRLPTLPSSWGCSRRGTRPEGTDPRARKDAGLRILVRHSHDLAATRGMPRIPTEAVELPSRELRSLCRGPRHGETTY
jgi:hypothetical protein